MVSIRSMNNNWRSNFISKDLIYANFNLIFKLIFLLAICLFHQLYDMNNFIDKKGKKYLKLKSNKFSFAQGIRVNADLINYL